MASSSSSSVGSLGPPISEKLTRDNFLLWKAQILPAIKGARLIGILDGSSKAPATTVTIEQSDKKSYPMRPMTTGWCKTSNSSATSSTP
ncbi:unnamed protein product [Urochloa humidicola]